MDDDLDNRFNYHRPTPELAEMHQQVRDLMKQVAKEMRANLPDCRERALVITKLEEAMFWANAAIARQGVLA